MAAGSVNLTKLTTEITSSVDSATKSVKLTKVGTDVVSSQVRPTKFIKVTKVGTDVISSQVRPTKFIKITKACTEIISSVGGPYFYAVRQDNPTAYLRFGEGLGIDAVYDYAGTGNNATLSGSFSRYVVGAPLTELDRAVLFDGVDGDTTTVAAVSSPTRASSYAFTSNFTIEVWLRASLASERTETQYICGKNLDGVSSFSLSLRPSGKVKFLVRNSSTKEASVFTKFRVDDGKWHHIVATFDNGVMKIYVDTHVRAQATALFSTVESSSYGFSVAGELNSSGSVTRNSFRGQLDEVALYNKTLDADRITAHYEAAGYTALPDTVVARFVSIDGVGTNRKKNTPNSSPVDVPVNRVTVHQNVFGPKFDKSGNIHSLVVPASISIDAAFEENPIQRVLYYTTQPYAVGLDDAFSSSIQFSNMVLRYNPTPSDVINQTAGVVGISVTQTYFPRSYAYVNETGGYDAVTTSASVSYIRVGTAYYPRNLTYTVADGSTFDSMTTASSVTYIEVGESYTPVNYNYVNSSGGIDQISTGAAVTGITIETA